MPSEKFDSMFIDFMGIETAEDGSRLYYVDYNGESLPQEIARELYEARLEFDGQEREVRKARCAAYTEALEKLNAAG